MRNFRIIILCFLISSLCQAQKVDDDFVAGTWKVIKIVKTHSNVDYPKVLQGLKNASYTFNKDKSCELNSSSSNDVYDVMIDRYKDSSWKLDEGIIKIIGNKDQYKVEDIRIIFEEEKVFFSMAEYAGEALVVEVEKHNTDLGSPSKKN